MTSTEFHQDIKQYMLENPWQRKGQAAFNLMYAFNYKVANEFRGTDIDPFYHDDRIDEFVKRCLAKT